MEEQNTMFEGNLSASEMANMTQALKNPEFRKLLAEYCNEMSDPKNQAIYEQELTQYEAERGIDLTFITPEPGFVIKTTVDDGRRQKVFINVSRNEKVDRPTSQYGCDAETGRRGLQWSIPLTQAPPRRDYDKKKQSCTVYDVVFHTDTLHLASRNHEFRQLVVNTACDAVESAFQVRLDRVNVKFPKMTFKGTPRPTVIRKKINKCSSSGSNSSPSSSSSSSSKSSGSIGEEQFYPKVDLDNLNGDRRPIVIKSKTAAVVVVPEFTVPKYKLVHRRGVDMHEMTQERDAKLNVTLPQELIATVDLPLLSSSKHVKLDVRERTMDLVSDLPGAKYKLNLRLPHSVLEDQGTAKFDSSTRQLVVRMPVNRTATDLHLVDLPKSLLTKQTSDSGVDSPSSHSHSSDEEISSSETSASTGSGFLDGSTGYTMPTFSTNVLDNDVVFTLNVKNVDPASVEVRRESNWLHIKFYSIGSGFAPSHCAFFVRFLGDSLILGDSVEPWDNNVVVQLNLSAATAEYEYGLDSVGELERGCLRTKSNTEKTDVERKTTKTTTKEISEASSGAFEVRVREGTPRTVMIELSKVSEQEGEEAETEEDVFGTENVPVPPPTNTTTKCNKKTKPVSKGKNEKKQKQRSLSESNCEDLKEQQKEAAVKLKIDKCAVSGEARNLANCGVGGIRKARSISESGCDIMDPNGNLFHFKSILKRRQLNRSVSESCSSASDDQPLGVSFDMGVGSFGDIPEEEDSDQPNGSCKKTVTFNDVIRKQLFR